ncbi:aspartate--ammonia ligase [Bacillus luteolus]|uniref:Aspartate--ammonia ligase n=1 Tax=Litchfieldia luteola TaxID=682179 RepID=A0ABR9QGH1_9BACI|nr:aspartate--ammonia ligase [Cytobacillus luteolus]MBE4907590.1 aspartate--ammonia ligase [Cytobacillus luteolus]
MKTTYESKLGLLQTEIAIKQTKDYFESELSKALILTRVSAPLFVQEGKGINDNLNGSERTISFDGLHLESEKLEIVQSLAKWKRIALQKYGLKVGQGLCTDMKAIRRDEELDYLHSFYVEQWDWEKVISSEQRNIHTLMSEVKMIYKVLQETENYLFELYPELEPVLPDEIQFISAQELENLFPTLTPKEREDKIAEQHGAVFIMQIGGELRSGVKHDGRSPDYDDWTLNGDLILWYPTLGCSVEISSMGIRVDRETLMHQLHCSGNQDRKELKYHQMILNNVLPYSIGGGIGQSRLCMFLLKKAHIGEVHASVWNESIIEECREANIPLL